MGQSLLLRSPWVILDKLGGGSAKQSKNLRFYLLLRSPCTNFAVEWVVCTFMWSDSLENLHPHLIVSNE